MGGNARHSVLLAWAVQLAAVTGLGNRGHAATMTARIDPVPIQSNSTAGRHNSSAGSSSRTPARIVPVPTRSGDTAGSHGPPADEPKSMATRGAAAGAAGAGDAQRGHLAIFIAGLEGTLHRFWTQVAAACTRDKKCHFPAPALRASLWDDRHNLDGLEKAWNSWETDGDSILYLNTPTQTLSYPSQGTRNNPQLQNYAAAATKNHDTLKVVVTLRNAGDMLQSAKKRLKRSEEDLVGSAHALLEQLRVLPKESWICVDVDSIPALAEKLESFLVDPHTGKKHFDMKGAVKEYYKDKRVSRCVGDGCNPPDLESALQAIRAECGRPYLPGAGFTETREAEATRVVDFLFGG